MAFIPAPVEDPRASCPVPVRRPCMIHEWNELTFLHWRYDAEAVQRLLPPGLEVETFDGSAWVGLVPFQMLVRPPGLPPLPWVSHFPETNVRTYARAADGSVGVFRVAWPGGMENGKMKIGGGDSWVSVIEFGDKVRAKVLLSYGNSTQRKSPHNGDQLKLFSEKQLRDAWIYRVDVVRHMEKSETLGKVPKD